MHRECVFCTISEGASDISIVVEDERTMTLLERGQFHTGHILVAPRAHVNDLRKMDDAMIDSLILAVHRAVYVVDLEFPGDGVSVWRSTAEPFSRGIAHAHFHVHPKHVARREIHRHIVAGEASSSHASTTVTERLRRRMLDTYDAAMHQTVTRSSLDDIRTYCYTMHSHTLSWCGCSERTAS